MRAAHAEGVNGRIFNVASSRSVSVNDLADAIGSVVGKPVEREFSPPRAGDIRDSWADVSAARKALGWEPSVDLETGLELTADALFASV
jgi:UDP-glucose 4-epimerase